MTRLQQAAGECNLLSVSQKLSAHAAKTDTPARTSRTTAFNRHIRGVKMECIGAQECLEQQQQPSVHYLTKVKCTICKI